jgi:hypothetical protein
MYASSVPQELRLAASRDTIHEDHIATKHVTVQAVAWSIKNELKGLIRHKECAWAGEPNIAPMRLYEAARRQDPAKRAGVHCVVLYCIM